MGQWLTICYTQGYLRAAKALYQAGHKVKANQALVKAASLAAQGSSSLATYAEDLHAAWNPPLIHRLPNETLLEVFCYLDATQVIVCQSVCRRWKDVTTSNPVLWRNSPVLKGSLEQLAAKLKKLYSMTGGGRVRSLSLVFVGDPPTGERRRMSASQRWRGLNMDLLLPLNSLEEFNCTNAHQEIEQQLWAALCRCRCLKILRWRCGEASSASRHALYETKGSPMADCRLQELVFIGRHQCRFDDRFADLLREARKIHVEAIGTRWSMRGVLEAAKDTVEDLCLKNVSDCMLGLSPHDPWEYMLPAEPAQERTVEMKSLRRFEGSLPVARSTEEARYRIDASTIKELITTEVDAAIVSMMHGSRRSVVELAYVAHRDVDVDTFDDFDFLLEDLSSCESLSMDMNHFVKGRLGVWDKIRIDHCTRDKDVRLLLPRLTSLIIRKDEALTGGELVTLIKYRSRFGLPPLQKLVLNGCINVSAEAVAWLRQHVPNFAFSIKTDP